MLHNIGIKKVLSYILNAVWLLINGFFDPNFNFFIRSSCTSPLPKYVNDVTSTMKFMFKY